jgi:hypothetical protein
VCTYIDSNFFFLELSTTTTTTEKNRLTTSKFNGSLKYVCFFCLFLCRARSCESLVLNEIENGLIFGVGAFFVGHVESRFLFSAQTRFALSCDCYILHLKKSASAGTINHTDECKIINGRQKRFAHADVEKEAHISDNYEKQLENQLKRTIYFPYIYISSTIHSPFETINFIKS